MLRQRQKRMDEEMRASKPKEKVSSQKVITITASAILILAHVAILLAILWSWRYYSIQPALFGSIVGIILCAMVIIDIVFFVGFNHKDLALKIISTVMAILLLVGGTVGAAALRRANGIVDNVLDDGKSEKYETFSGVFVCYDKNNKFTSLADLAGKKVGMLTETSNGLTYIATNLLSKEKIDYATVDYKTNAEMMQGLLDGDVDAIVITSAYRTIYKGVEENAATEEGAEETSTVELTETEEGSEESADPTAVVSETEESPFTKYLPNLIDFYSFEEELKTDKQRSTKNLSTDPFNVLLIGYSRTDIGSTVGLADSIILTTINPQTYEVSMTSIARDSFVPIPCYGNEYDKINSGRSTSRACFIETVEQFMGMDIDYYMELDYLGLVQIVNTIGGIYINNPVSFTLDGIYVPAGEHVFADGQMALQFCRERHHMPNGDFDRQQHQKEVIIEIAKAFVESGSVTLALKAMEEASEWMSTDLTLSQLTSVFNLLLNTKNYTGIDTFDLVDFQNTRITGYGGIMYYSYSMRLPLWVYLIYQGSYDESVQHINNVMGNYTSVTQTRNLEFSLDSEYERPTMISTDYEHKFLYEPDPMPAYWAALEGLSQSSAMSWASANGVSLSVNIIKSTDPGYDKNYEGLVVEQSPRYGSLVSEYPSGSITVMGPSKIDENKQVPDFVEHNYAKAVKWAREHGVPYDIDFNTSVSGKVGDVVSQSPAPGTYIENVSVLKLVVKAGIRTIRFDANGHGSAPNPIEIMTGDDAVTFKTLADVEEGGDTYVFQGWFTSPGSDGERVYDSDDVSGDATVYAHWKKYCNHSWGEWTTVTEATCTSEGSRTHKCSKCGEEETETISALGHDFQQVERVEATTESEGYIKYRCSRCGEEYTETIPKLEPEPEPEPTPEPEPPADGQHILGPLFARWLKVR